MKNWLLKNPNYYKQYYQKNKEKIDKYNTEWAKKNAEKVKIYQREYQKEYNKTHKIKKSDRIQKDLEKLKKKAEEFKMSINNI